MKIKKQSLQAHSQVSNRCIHVQVFTPEIFLISLKKKTFSFNFVTLSSFLFYIQESANNSHFQLAMRMESFY